MLVQLEPGGLVVQLDEEDLPLVGTWRWYQHSAGYAAGRGPGRRPQRVFLHRLVMGSPVGKLVDHRNGDPTDNRRSNLRVTDRKGNGRNRQKVLSATGFRGVSAHSGRFVARIKCDGKAHHLGMFETAEEAARAYDRAALDLFGEFASPNFR